MKTLVCIQAHASVLPIVEQNIRYYLMSGCDLAGISGQDSEIKNWPSGFKFSRTVGPTDPRCFDLHARRIVEMFEWCLTLPDYDYFLATEYDSMFSGSPIPPIDGIGTFLAGYCDPRWQCGDGPFLHPPFFISRSTAEKAVDTGRRLLSERIIGNRTPDVFMGLICTEAKIQIEQAHVYSCNALDMRIAEKMQEARACYLKGAWHIHGVKRTDHIDFITGKTNQFPTDTFFKIP